MTLVKDEIGVLVMSPYEWAEAVAAVEVSFEGGDEAEPMVSHVRYIDGQAVDFTPLSGATLTQS